MRSLLLALLCCCLPWSATAASAALAPALLPGKRPPPLSSYQRITYMQDSGIPRSISKVLQTTDGFLWLVSANALYRFDGMRVERYELPGEPFSLAEGQRATTSDDRNGLWFGYIRGGVAHLRDNRIVRYGPDAGLPDGSQVTDIAARDGKVYAATQSGLFALQGERWVPFAALPQLHGTPIDSLLIDAAGRLWIRAAAQLFHQRQADGPFEQRMLPEDSLVGGLIGHPDGSVWSWNHNGTHNLCRLFPDTAPACWQADDMVRPIFDAEGALWWSQPHRTYRVSDTASLDRDAPDDLAARAEAIDLPGSYVQQTLDDSIWILGDQGVSRLRRPIIERTATPSGGLAGGAGGEAWLVSYSRGLMRIGSARQARGPLMAAEDDSLWDPPALAEDDPADYRRWAGPLYGDDAVVLERHLQVARSGMRIDRDGNGDLLVCRLAPIGLLRYRDGQASSVPIPAFARGAVLRGAKRDAGGHLWLGVSRHDTPLYQQRGEQWVALGGRPVPAGTRLNGYGFDAQDTLWIAAGIDGVLAVDATSARRFGNADGLDIGTAVDIHASDGRIWAIGMQGIAVQDGTRFVTLRGRDGERFALASGFIQRRNGDIWLSSIDGITRILADEWRRALAEPDYAVRYTRLDRWDGINSPALSGPFPAAAESEDGTLWFSMQAGLYRLVPDALQPPQPPPPVVLGSLGIDGNARPAVSGERFAPGLQRVVLGFHAPLAERPERTQFRYRFARDGRWGDWVLLGGVRQIAFDQLEHGDYAIEIAASGRDGDWPEQATAFAFRILPAFHQTWVFYALLALTAGAALYGLYLLRVRQLSGQLHSQMDARLRERERIARDLHDTLLQGMQSLLLSFQGVASRMASGDPLRTRMEQVLDRTEDVLREGRERVSQLRDPNADTLDLGDALQRHARPLAVDRNMLCELDMPHPPRPLQPAVHEELLQVGREAIGNAFNHSKGTAVKVVLDYRDDGVCLTVRDDGVGLADADEPTGHWGLHGMRERAGLVGARLEMRRRPEGGTDILMHVPAARAYPAPASRH